MIPFTLLLCGLGFIAIGIILFVAMDRRHLPLLIVGLVLAGVAAGFLPSVMQQSIFEWKIERCQALGHDYAFCVRQYMESR